MTWPTVRAVKYGNKKTVIKGICFDSKKEAQYYLFLLSEQNAGRIKEVKLQPTFVLQPSFKRAGKTIKAITYKADFEVLDDVGHRYYIDTKGYKTQVYDLKKKMLFYVYPDIDFREEF